jgi:hypothetical protein
MIVYFPKHVPTNDSPSSQMEVIYDEDFLGKRIWPQNVSLEMEAINTLPHHLSYKYVISLP